MRGEGSRSSAPLARSLGLFMRWSSRDPICNSREGRHRMPPFRRSRPAAHVDGISRQSSMAALVPWVEAIGQSSVGPGERRKTTAIRVNLPDVGGSVWDCDIGSVQLATRNENYLPALWRPVRVLVIGAHSGISGERCEPGLIATICVHPPNVPGMVLVRGFGSVQ